MHLRIAEEHPRHIGELVDKANPKFGILTHSFFERIDSLKSWDSFNTAYGCGNRGVKDFTPLPIPRIHHKIRIPNFYHAK